MRIDLTLTNGRQLTLRNVTSFCFRDGVLLYRKAKQAPGDIYLLHGVTTFHV